MNDRLRSEPGLAPVHFSTFEMDIFSFGGSAGIQHYAMRDELPITMPVAAY